MGQIYFSVICVLGAIFITTSIVLNNKDYDGRLAPGWWIVGLGISQSMLIAAASVWWPEWWLTHEWILILSMIIAVLSAAVWGIVKTAQHRW